MSSTLLPLSVGLGLVLSVLWSERFGLATAAMIVPGYMALKLDDGGAVLFTVSCGLLTWLLVRAASSFTITYGRRRTALTFLVGYALVVLLRGLAPRLSLARELDFELIGYVIPALIAIALDRHGPLQALGALATTSIVVRLLLIVIAGAELAP